jgi:hypothetical protein
MILIDPMCRNRYGSDKDVFLRAIQGGPESDIAEPVNCVGRPNRSNIGVKLSDQAVDTI